jgi:pimeloyl-ACP methyl ester carboxylesterase
MNTPEPRSDRSADTTSWSPRLPAADGFEHLVVETPGLRTHVAVIGAGDPVVLLHGFPQHWWQWREVATAIAEADYRVYVADAPHIERETRLHDLLALYDVLQIERAHLLSHDMGSITAIQLTYDHPERVRAAVQLSVPPFFMSFSPRSMPGFRHLPAFIWHRRGASLASTFSEAYVAHPLSKDTIDTHLSPFRRPEVDAAVRPLVRGMVLREARRMAGGTYRRRRLTVPTLVVLGRRDRPWTEAHMARTCRKPERFADRLEFAYVDDAAHFITDDAPEEVARLALDWFARAA